jgi:hypothetical protein
MDAPYQAREPGAATLATVGFDSTLARMPDWHRKVKHWSGLLFLARVSEAFPSGEVVEEKFDAFSRTFGETQDRPCVLETKASSERCA